MALALTPKQIIDAWNAQADPLNQWDSLGQDEVIGWTVKCVTGAERDSEKSELIAHGLQHAPDGDFMRQVLAVAIAGLYEHYPQDVIRVFSLADLEAIVSTAEPLLSQRVEDIYKQAWDMLNAAPSVPVQRPTQQCWCNTCRPSIPQDLRFVVCPDCGNKRCPKANDRRNACTDSNDVVQKGASWEHVKPVGGCQLMANGGAS